MPLGGRNYLLQPGNIDDGLVSFVRTLYEYCLNTPSVMQVRLASRASVPQMECKRGSRAVQVSKKCLPELLGNQYVEFGVPRHLIALRIAQGTELDETGLDGSKLLHLPRRIVADVGELAFADQLPLTAVVGNIELVEGDDARREIVTLVGQVSEAFDFEGFTKVDNQVGRHHATLVPSGPGFTIDHTGGVRIGSYHFPLRARHAELFAAHCTLFAGSHIDRNGTDSNNAVGHERTGVTERLGSGVSAVEGIEHC